MNNPVSEPFPGVIGQIEQRRLIMRAITSNRLAHAYLFIGPAGTGKRALAVEIARVLNCPKGMDSALSGCDCQSCSALRKWRHPNLQTIFPLPALKRNEKDEGVASDAALNDILNLLAVNPYAPLHYSGTGQILIDHVREAREKVSLTPEKSGTRVIVIHPADRMNDAASNALLKLLEEPPEKCLLILTAESRRDLLPTILSRCQQVKFPPLPPELISEILTARHGIGNERAMTMAALANGSYTHAIELIDSQTDVMTTSALDFLRAVAMGNAAKISESIDGWLAGETSRELIKNRLDITGLWIIDALTVLGDSSNGEPSRLRIPNSATSVTRMAQKFGSEKLLSALQEIEEAKLAIDANSMQSLALTVLAIKLKRIFLS